MAADRQSRNQKRNIHHGETEKPKSKSQSQNLNTEGAEKLRRTQKAEDLPNKILRGMARI
jgi:hypothetical protein